MLSLRPFVLLLSKEIQGFPLPDRSLIVNGNIGYEQEFGGRDGTRYYSDAVIFWCSDSAPPSVAAKMDAYVVQTHMNWEDGLAKTPGTTFVRVVYSGRGPQLRRA